MQVRLPFSSSNYYFNLIIYFWIICLIVDRIASNDIEVMQFVEHMVSSPNFSVVHEASSLFTKKYSSQKAELQTSEKLLWKLLSIVLKFRGQVS